MPLPTYPLYLNGQFVLGTDQYPVLNPSTAQPFAQMSAMERGQIAQAISAAHEAFVGWRSFTSKARSEALLRVASELDKRRDECARLITFENGKPLSQSHGELSMALDHLRWFAEEAKRAEGRSIPHWVDSKRHWVVRVPIGVVGAIAPWNFPLMLAVRKVAPALAAGNTVLLKPARQTSLSAVLFAECVQEAGLPKGVFQLVQGAAREVGAEFLSNPLLRKISFTGSTETGQLLIRGAAETVKPLALELGGAAPVLVFADADIAQAVEGVLAAKFRNSGQSCIAANRIFVERPVYEDFLQRFIERAGELKTGDGFEPEVQIGPLIDAATMARAVAQIQDARQKGARLLLGGGRIDRPGYFLEPTVLADVPDHALCASEEIFAPVAAFTPFDGEEEVIRKANSTRYGLAAYAFTRDLSRTFRLMENLECGILGINDGIPTATQAPFGGCKQSGWGRELGSEGLDAFLETRHVSIGIQGGGS